MWDDSITRERLIGELGKLRKRIVVFQSIALSVVFGVLIWVIDAMIDFFAFKEDGISFFDFLISDLTTFELYARLVISGSFFGFGMIMSVFMAKRRGAEEALRGNEVKLRTILESIPDAVTIADMDQNITGFNQATMNLHGFSTED